jgi:hypothetical protein
MHVKIWDKVLGYRVVIMMPLIGNQRQDPSTPMLYLVTGHLFLVIFLFSVFIHPEHLDPDYVRISIIATFLYLPFSTKFYVFCFYQ